MGIPNGVTGDLEVGVFTHAWDDQQNPESAGSSSCHMGREALVYGRIGCQPKEDRDAEADLLDDYVA
jgi:hypothetical protein